MVRLIALLALVLAMPASAQSPFWAEAPASEAPIRSDLLDYRVVRLDLDGLRTALAAEATTRARMTLRVPLPEGGALDVDVMEAPVLAPALQARYPEIRTYIAQGAANGRLSMTPLGLSGLLYDAEGAIVIDPLGEPDATDVLHHAVFRASSLTISEGVLESITDDLLDKDGLHEIHSAPATATQRRAAPIGETLRTYRLAVAVRGEYTERRARGSVARALAFVTSSVNRVNAIFERDLALRFELVENNDQIVYADSQTDPFTTTGGELLDETQRTIDDVIGTENYDIGHLISFDEGGGLAGLGVACDPSAKSFAYSGVGREVTPFDLLVFPHELGHQLGAPHAFVQPSSDFDPSFGGVEPGPGYTIMSYPHFAAYRRVQEQVGYHFHGASIDDMDRFVRSEFGTCGTDTPIDNDVPVVTAEDLVTVPPGAFFTLDSEATDNSGTTLTYAWEQMDIYGNGTGAIPLIRALDPSPLSARTIPDLGRFLDRKPYPDEDPLEAGVTYQFQVTVRDNLAGGGAQSVATTRVRVTDTEDTFEITSVLEDVAYQVGDLVEVTWNVAGTDGGELSVAAVDVLVSTDNGDVWTPVAEGVPNTGAALVTMPMTPSDEARLMVRAVGAPFFTVAAEPFALTSVVSTADDATPDALSVSAVWPNPTADRARVLVRLPEPTPLRATVYDALGRTIAVVENRDAIGAVTLQVDLDDVAAGVYLLRVEGPAFVETRRFVVAR